MKSKLYTCFVLLCTCVFLYQAFVSVKDFMNQTPLTKTSLEKQELHPLPAICIEPLGRLRNASLHNLTVHGYRKEGKWRSASPDFDDEQTYNNLSASFEDLVEEIKIKRDINDGSDAYKQ